MTFSHGDNLQCHARTHCARFQSFYIMLVNTLMTMQKLYNIHCLWVCWLTHPPTKDQTYSLMMVWLFSTLMMACACYYARIVMFAWTQIQTRWTPTSSNIISNIAINIMTMMSNAWTTPMLMFHQLSISHHHYQGHPIHSFTWPTL
jgi:hypothetical protein